MMEATTTAVAEVVERRLIGTAAVVAGWKTVVVAFVGQCQIVQQTRARSTNSTAVARKGAVVAMLAAGTIRRLIHVVDITEVVVAAKIILMVVVLQFVVVAAGRTTTGTTYVVLGAARGGFQRKSIRWADFLGLPKAQQLARQAPLVVVAITAHYAGYFVQAAKQLSHQEVSGWLGRTSIDV